MKDVVLSIACITYNHEAFIADAIEGFLLQITDFDYEILIGEDCSTDNTMSIIEAYKEKYPEKIKVITSMHNVGFRQNITRLLEQAQGKYVAICEGDDYWIDSHKLQLQVDYMESHTECSYTYHGTRYMDGNTGRFMHEFRSYQKDCISPIEDIIIHGGGFVPSASVVYRKSCWQEVPKSYIQGSVGDYPRQIILASRGTVYYFDKIMSIYRYRHNDSWTSLHMNNGANKIKHSHSMIKTLNLINMETEGKYDAAIKQALAEHTFKIAYYNFDLKAILKKEHRTVLKKMPLIKRWKLYFRCIFPNIYRFFKTL